MSGIISQVISDRSLLSLRTENLLLESMYLIWSLGVLSPEDVKKALLYFPNAL